MKKNLMFLLVVITILVSATSVFATTEFGPGATNTTNIGNANLVPSTSVCISAIANDSTYCAAAVHTSAMGKDAGNEYGATSGDSTIKSVSAVSQTPDGTCSPMTKCGSDLTLPSTFK